MARPIVQLQAEIRSLSDSDKESLLRTLWEELDGPADPDVEAAWLDEASARSRAIDAGTSDPIPADDVFRRAEAAIKR